MHATSDISAEVRRARWYHTIELPGGVVTRGTVDTVAARERVPIPASLVGKRCLDIGTQDGFWAFEMEKRGAREVIATDVPDWMKGDRPHHRPPQAEAHPEGSTGRAATPFDIARRALGSNVEFRELSMYDVSPEAVGEFDFVFVGSLLCHLRDPVAALDAVRTVVRGELLVNDAISLPLTLLRPASPAARILASHGYWSMPNTAALRRLVEAGGFRVVATGRPYRVRAGPGYWRGDHAPLGVPRLARRFVRHVLGVPHAWVRAVPAGRSG